MNYEKYHRRSIRLKGYDYSQAGAYCVTICTQNRECIFGEIIIGEMLLNDFGKYVQQCWQNIPNHFPHAKSDVYCVMPNHIHGIIVITETVGAKDFSPIVTGNGVGIGNRAKGFSPIVTGNGVGTGNRAKGFSPLRRHKPTGTSKTIGSIVRGFKIGVTKWARQRIPDMKLWQRNYYEHIIRDENDYNRIYKYIENNPSKWALDSLNPHKRGNNTDRNHCGGSTGTLSPQLVGKT